MAKKAEADELVLVVFGAPWCGYCPPAKKALAKLAKTEGERYESIELGGEPGARPKGPDWDLARRYRASSLPTCLVFRAADCPVGAAPVHERLRPGAKALAKEVGLPDRLSRYDAMLERARAKAAKGAANRPD